MQTWRDLRRLLSATALLGVASCSSRLPSQPAVGTPGPPPTEAAVSDSTLQANQALWSASHVDGYRYRFAWECYCGYDYVRIVDITVRGGAVVSVTDAKTRKPLDAESAARYRTIEGLFDFGRSALAYPAASVNGAFDSGLGYPAAMHVDYERGLADEEMGFRIYTLTRFFSRSSASAPGVGSH